MIAHSGLCGRRKKLDPKRHVSSTSILFDHHKKSSGRFGIKCRNTPKIGQKSNRFSVFELGGTKRSSGVGIGIGIKRNKRRDSGNIITGDLSVAKQRPQSVAILRGRRKSFGNLIYQRSKQKDLSHRTLTRKASIRMVNKKDSNGFTSGNLQVSKRPSIRMFTRKNRRCSEKKTNGKRCLEFLLNNVNKNNKNKIGNRKHRSKRIQKRMLKKNVGYGYVQSKKGEPGSNSRTRSESKRIYPKNKRNLVGKKFWGEGMKVEKQKKLFGKKQFGDDRKNIASKNSPFINFRKLYVSAIDESLTGTSSVKYNIISGKDV